MDNIYNDPMVLRQIIMKHYQKPTHKGFTNHSHAKYHRVNSPTCIDDITMELVIENNLIKTARFEGVACTISTSSTDIIAELIENQTIVFTVELIKNYQQMLTKKEYNDNELKELIAFKNTHKQANRIKCAKIGVDAIEVILNVHKEEL